jgi:Putative prokaryotic signal transducing protein
VSASGFDRQHRDFAARYAQMTAGELLKLASEACSLSDVAWEALEDELDKRGLDIPDAETSSPTLLDSRNLVLLRRFRDIPEALLAKGRLEAYGVECFLADENMVRMDWFISNLLGGVKLLVEPSDFTRASRLLNEASGNEIDPDKNEV